MVKKIIRSALLLLFLLLVIAYIIKRPSWVSEHELPAGLAVDPLQLQQHVKFLSTQTNRSFEDANGLKAASDYIQQQFSAMGLNPVIQEFKVEDRSYHNIAVNVGPETDEIIVVGAHYDAYNDLPGADDNASGVAGLIELARLLQKNPPKQAIELVAYTLEEPPFFRTEQMGSYIHANDLNRPVKLMISLEMIGYFTDEANSQNYPTFLMDWIYPSQGDFIAVIDRLLSTEGQQLKNTINRYADLEAYSVNAPTMIPGVDFSDHRSYWAKGIPAVMVTDTAFYRNQRYHSADDTYDTLNYEKMSQVVLGVYMHVVQ